MAENDIQEFSPLLKRLEEEMIFLKNLMSQGEIVVSNMKGAWTAISVTHENWKRKIEEDLI